MLPKWLRKDLEYMDTQGYKIVKCDSEEDALNVKEELKLNKRCAQAGYIINKDNEKIYFVLTKERAKKGETNEN